VLPNGPPESLKVAPESTANLGSRSSFLQVLPTETLPEQGGDSTPRAEVNDKVNYNSFLENEFNVGYTEPFILGTQNNARLNLIESRKIYLIDNRNNLDYAV